MCEFGENFGLGAFSFSLFFCWGGGGLGLISFLKSSYFA